MKRAIQLTSVLTVLGMTQAAMAVEPECSTAPRSDWKDAKAFQESLKDEGYTIRTFNETSGGCYEIYGHDVEGKRVEIYFNPVNGEIVKQEVGD